MDPMSITHAPQPAAPSEEGDRQPAMHEPVVHHEIGETKGGHARAHADGNRRPRSVHIASDHDERGGDRRVRCREHVVRLETSTAPRVMRAVDAPEQMVPDLTVQYTSPRLHQGGHHHA
jgi:hypothetical protein